MAEPFLSEIRIMGFNFAPRGWAQCDGQILPINQNQSLYSLLGTTFGGDGRTTFGLPDLRGRAPIHVGQLQGGSQRNLGSKSGEATHTLVTAEIPAHSHPAAASGANATTGMPMDQLFAIPTAGGGTPFAEQSSTPDVSMRNNMIVNEGGGQAHNNMQPYLALNFCIALQGTFPSRN